MNDNAIGLHVQAQGKTFDRAKFFDHARRAQYRTATILDDLQLAIDLGTILSMPYAVYRDYSFAPKPGNDPLGAAHSAYIYIKDKINSHPNGRNAFFMVNCEHGFSLNHCKMWTELVRLSAFDPGGPIGLVLGNTASGSIKCGQGNEPNQWLTEGQPLLRALHQYRNMKLPNGSYAFVLGDHYYTGLFPWIAVNGGEKNKSPRWEDRPLSIDWSKPQWHLGRGIQGIVNACKSLAIEPPWMLITESLIDDMDDVAYTFGNRETGVTGLKLADGYKKARGWRSLIPQWAEWYPGREPGELLADMHIWAWEVIYKPLGFVLGTHTYCYANTGTWDSFQVDNAPGYLKRMERYAEPPIIIVAPPPVPTPPTAPAPVPKPENAGKGVNVTVMPPAPVLNMRDGPNETYTKVGEINGGATITLFRDTCRLDPDNPLQRWYWAETDHGCGWIADINGKVKFEDAPIEPPTPTKLELSLTAHQAHSNFLQQMIDRFISEKAMTDLVIRQIESGVL